MHLFTDALCSLAHREAIFMGEEVPENVMYLQRILYKKGCICNKQSIV